MNLIQHYDKDINKYVYFWIRQKDNVIMSPFWADKNDAEQWLIAIGIELGAISEKEEVRHANTNIKDTSE